MHIESNSFLILNCYDKMDYTSCKKKANVLQEKEEDTNMFSRVIHMSHYIIIVPSLPNSYGKPDNDIYNSTRYLCFPDKGQTERNRFMKQNLILMDTQIFEARSNVLVFQTLVLLKFTLKFTLSAP